MNDAIKQAAKDITTILETYTNWWRKFEHGEVSYSLYHDLTEFVNERMETIDACRILLENERVADTLGLNRALLENYLLYILMCRGEKYFRIRTLKRSEKLDKILEDERKKIGTGSLVAVEVHPTLKRHILYIFEGLKSSTDNSFIPYHFFSIKEFDPESMRLDDDNYFTYYDAGDTVRARDLQHKKEQNFMYRHYMSYDGLLNCLRINEITDEAAIHRIQAHYTYLGRFLHPTHEAFRSLRERSNYHSERTIVGTEYPYERSAVLMAYAYTIHNAIGYLDELANVLDNAPAENFKSSGSEDVHKVIDEMRERYSYFWYIFNEPPDHAKFNYVIHHLSDAEFEAIGKDYRRVDPSIVTFNKHIYGSFQDAMGGWSNRRVGSYKPPYMKQ